MTAFKNVSGAIKSVADRSADFPIPLDFPYARSVWSARVFRRFWFAEWRLGRSKLGGERKAAEYARTPKASPDSTRWKILGAHSGRGG